MSSPSRKSPRLLARQEAAQQAAKCIASAVRSRVWCEARNGVDAARGRDPAFRRARFAHPSPGRPHQQAKLLCPLKLYGQAKLLQDSLLSGLRD